MGDFPASGKVLKHVAWRLYAARVTRRFVWMLFLVAAVYAVVLGVSKSVFIPGVSHFLTPASLGVIPALAALLSLVTVRFPQRDDAARAVDTRYKTRDLFLTLTMLDQAAGEYKPLVGKDAETRAKSVQPEQVVPLDPLGNRRRQNLVSAVVAIGVALFLLTSYVPQFDILGVKAEADEVEKKSVALAEAKKATDVRKAELDKKDVDEKNSEQVEQALNVVKQDLRKMEKGKRKENAERLAGDQKMLGEKFRGLANDLKSLLNKELSEQQFGSGDLSEFRKMQKELQEGNPEAMAKKMDEIKEELQRLAKTDDPVKKAELQRQIQKKMDDLADLAKDQGAKSMQAALQRAMDQLDAAKDGKLSTEALQQAMESMDLSKMELQQMAQSVRDMKSLEEALKTLSKAKQLNGKDQLDGEMADAAASMEDYEALYEEMMAKMRAEGMGEGEGEGEGDGDGDGTGGEGMGRGGRPPEDDSVTSNFKNEQAKTQVQKGKVLLSLKTKGLTETGDAKKEYRQSIEAIKQGADEAIEEEQVPPGYHETIKKYFNSLEKADGKAAEAAEPAEEPKK